MNQSEDRAPSNPEGPAPAAVALKASAGDGGVARGPMRRVSTNRALVLAVGITFALVVAAGNLPRRHPLVPGLYFGSSTKSSPQVMKSSPQVMRPITVPFGATDTLEGATHADGSVEVDGRWNHGPWRALEHGTASHHRYMIRFPINGHGTLEFRVKYPGGEAEGTIHVPTQPPTVTGARGR